MTSAPDSTSPVFVIRPPSATTHPGYTQPPLSFMLGSWHVTHSTLPMWRSKRNVVISYKALAASSSYTRPADLSPDEPATDRLDDNVAYQGLSSSSVSTVAGVDTASDPKRTDAWNWRGKGWLKIATSHWSVLGWGTDAVGNEWIVTYFGSTLFTPAGIDFYSRSGKGMAEGTVEGLKKALLDVQSEDLGGLAKGLFEVPVDAGQ